MAKENICFCTFPKTFFNNFINDGENKLHLVTSLVFMGPLRDKGYIDYRDLILVQIHKCLLLIMGLHIFEIKLC